MTRSQIGPVQTAFPESGDGFGYGFAVVTGEESTAAFAPVGSYSWGGAFSTYFWVDPGHELFSMLMTQRLRDPDSVLLRQQFARSTYDALKE